jgi:WD40 repeat protein
LVLANVAGQVAVSRDERHFAYLSGGTDQSFSVIVAASSPASRKTILTRNAPDFLRYGLSWSPDGNLLALPIGSFDDRFWQIENVLMVPVTGGNPVTFSPVKWSFVPNVTWLPNGRGLLVNGIAQAAGNAQIWFTPYPSGEARRVTNDLSSYSGVDVTADSSTFVTVQKDEPGEMWTTAPGGETPVAFTRTSTNGDGVGGMNWTPDGKLVYASKGGSQPDLWLANADGTLPKRLTFGGVAIDPEVAPDGRTIYFGSERSGACHIWRMDTDGSNASQVTHGQSEESAAVSPDGKWLLYDVFSFTGSSSIWKMPLPSGTPVRMGDLKDASAPSIAPDGQSFSLSYNDDRFHPAAGVGIMRLDGTGFKPLNIPPTWKTRWNGDGSALYFVKSEQGVCNIWRQAIAGGAPVRVTNFNSGSMGWLAVSRDERLAFRHFSTIFDVVLVRSVE